MTEMVVPRRWQYVVASMGAFDAKTRMARVLGHLGEQGYELVTVYDKSSNWFAGMEKGFMLFKREVLAGEPAGPWCGIIDPHTLMITEPAPPDPGQPW